MDYRPEHYLKVPPQTLTTLSFCEPNVRALRDWVSGLPMASVGDASRQLYHAVIEFNQLCISDPLRLELMDMVREPIHYVCSAMSQKYLNQGIDLAVQQRKIANLAQALQTHLAIGYKIVAQNLLAQGAVRHKTLTVTALHRTLGDLIPSLLRSYQLYIPSPAGLWREIHQLYQIAAAFDLHTTPVEELADGPSSTIQDLYLTATLLGSSQPNQLLQHELAELYGLLLRWAPLLEIDAIANDKSVLVIKPETDQPPQYSYLIDPGSMPEYLGVNTMPIVKLLHDEITRAEYSPGPHTTATNRALPENFNLVLLEHLIQSWAGMKQRTFSRTPSGSRVSVAVGLTGTHFHMSDGVDFYAQLHDPSAVAGNPFTAAAGAGVATFESASVESDEDISDESPGAGKASLPGNSEDRVEVPKNIQEDHPCYAGLMINVSPRGYCIQWTDKAAGNLKTGEVVAIREQESEHWDLGVVRWLRQSRDAGTQMGVELIAPNSQPCGVRQIHNTGKRGNYLRGLFIPEIRAIGQEASVLTAHRPFQVGNRVTINIGGNESNYQLTKRVLGTGILSQCKVRKVASDPVEPDSSKASDDNDDGFESLWLQL